MAEAGMKVQPDCHPGAHSDVNLSAPRLGDNGIADYFVKMDIAVGCLGRHRGAGMIDRHLAVGRLHLKISDDLTNPGVPVAVLDRGRATDPVDRDRPRARGELGVPGDLLNGDIAELRSCTGIRRAPQSSASQQVRLHRADASRWAVGSAHRWTRSLRGSCSASIPWAP